MCIREEPRDEAAGAVPDEAAGAAPDKTAPAPDPPARTLEETIAAARVEAPSRGNRKLEALLTAANADDQVRTWWYMAQIHAERLGMSDHSWVHVRIVLNIALRILRLLVK